jgi:DNA-binding SARP family transcriptional activator
VRIGLLGNLIIHSQGEALRISAGRQRSLLAALAVTPNEAVPADMLAEVIWDGTPPRSWPVTIRNYVKRLRHVLHDHAGDRIVTNSPGYMLQVVPNEVDLALFEIVRKSGHQAAAAGDWLQASATLSQALSLWRGAPFADIPSQHIRDSHAPYLEEARLAAQTVRIHADLLVHPSSAPVLVPELQRLAQEYPLREQLRAELMMALYLAGRQADALATYAEARQVIVAELGIEPGDELTQMQHRILIRDPSLRLAHSSGYFEMAGIRVDIADSLLPRPRAGGARYPGATETLRAAATIGGGSPLQRVRGGLRWAGD